MSLKLLTGEALAKVPKSPLPSRGMLKLKLSNKLLQLFSVFFKQILRSFLPSRQNEGFCGFFHLV
jgi:hypothetical protein